MLDGYAPPEDVDFLLESMGPHIQRRLIQALRDAASGVLNEGLTICLDSGKVGSAVWRVKREATERVTLSVRQKRA